MSQPNGNARDLTLTLTTDEVNLVLQAVGRLPFVKVYGLVAKIQQQARQQLEGAPLEAPDAT